MAFLADDDKLKQNNVAGAPTVAAAAQAPSGPIDVSASSSSVVGSGQGTAGAAGGANGAWTNIQAYMNANTGDNGSAAALDSKVKSQFNTEKATLQQDTEKAKSDAQTKVNAVSEAQKNAAAWTEQAGKEYNWNGTNQSDAYNANKSNLQNALTGQYSGPTSYNYGFTADTQKTGAALQDRGVFNQYMGDLYNEKAGGQLSSGGRALQTQLDVNNAGLDQTRQSLASEYANLGAFRDQTVTDTTKALGDAEKSFRTNQNSLYDYLTNQANALDTDIAKQESDARYSFDQADRQEFSRREAERRATGQGSNLQFNQLPYDTLSGIYEGENFGSGQSIRSSLAGWDAEGVGKFLSEQQNKFKDVGDAQERQWNFISDVLGNSARKEQGFNVRKK